MVSAILRDLGKKSTVKGVPRIFQTKSTCMTVVWVVFVCAFLALTIYQIVTGLLLYLSYPVSGTVNEIFYESQPTTQVTLCNLNPFSGNASQAVGFPTLQEFYDAVQEASSCDDCDQEEADVLRQFRQRLLTPAGYYAYVGSENARSISHSADSFFASCQLIQDGIPSATIPCGEILNITEYHNSVHYTCFTVDMPQTSLTLVLHLDNFFMDPYRYFTSSPGAALMSGVKVMFHEQGHPPVPSGDSIIVSPGTFSSVNLDIARSLRLEPPYGNCGINEEYLSESTYSRPVCVALVTQDRIFDECGCVYSGYYDGLADLEGPSCLDVQRDPSTTCVEEILSDETYPSADCPMPCSEMFYGAQVSQTVWPSWPFQEQFFDEYIAGRPYESRYNSLQGLTPDTAMDEDLDLLSRNFLALSIHPDHGILEYKKEAEYTLNDFFVDAAIATHIWLGISMVVFVEIIEIMVELCCRCGNKKVQDI